MKYLNHYYYNNQKQCYLQNYGKQKGGGMVSHSPQLYRIRLLNTRQLAGGMKAASTRLVNKYKLRKLDRPVIKSAWVLGGLDTPYMI
jgi:hypothetical protein